MLSSCKAFAARCSSESERNNASLASPLTMSSASTSARRANAMASTRRSSFPLSIAACNCSKAALLSRSCLAANSRFASPRRASAAPIACRSSSSVADRSVSTAFSRPCEQGEASCAASEAHLLRSSRLSHFALAPCNSARKCSTSRANCSFSHLPRPLCNSVRNCSTSRVSCPLSCSALCCSSACRRCNTSFSSRRLATSLAWAPRSSCSSLDSPAFWRLESCSCIRSSSSSLSVWLWSVHLSSSSSRVNTSFWCLKACICVLPCSMQADACSRRSLRKSSSSLFNFSFWCSRIPSWSLFLSASASCFCRSSSSFNSVEPMSSSWLSCLPSSAIRHCSSAFLFCKA
mmetsp:Transcript_63386/g.175700  ORF Transcript_63386/g.175700 Transcript_63386/m.175700 type:complete len:347 (-) Transcript_63386:971-2011(-)